MKQFKAKGHLSLFSVFFLLISFLFCDHFCLAQSLEEDIVFKAMQDELNRTTEKLQMENLERPYYVGYTINQFELMEITSSFGALTKSEKAKRRFLTVDLRVGDYAFDNTNFIADYWGMSPSYTLLALEDDYDAIRHEIWLLTDQAYKKGLETLSQKKAYVQNKAITDLPEDFSEEEPYTYSEPTISLEVDSAYWVENRHNQSLICLEVLISTQAEDGQEIFNFTTHYSKAEEDLPEKEKLKEKVRQLAQRTLAVTKSEPLTEYVGPVILTQQAAGEFFRQLFAANIADPRTPLLADERFSFLIRKPKLVDKVNRTIMPGFISLKDDPAISRWEDSPLIGGLKVDDDGIMAQSVNLVDKGKLVDLPMSRIPTKKVKKSNGHARGTFHSPPKGRFTNLIVTSDETISYHELKSELIEYCKEMGLEYGIIVRKLKDKNLEMEKTFDFSRLIGMPQKEKELTPPLEVYRVWVKDGKEELIRGAEFEAVTVKTLKDISQTADDYYVHNFLLGHDDQLPTSIVAPSILIEEMELKKTEAKATKPPYLKSPLSGP